MLRRLTEIAARDAHADLLIGAQFRKRAERVRKIEGVMKVGHENRRAEWHRHMGCDRRHDQKLAAVTNVVVKPDPAETSIGSELRESNEIRNGVVIGQMG